MLSLRNISRLLLWVAALVYFPVAMTYVHRKESEVVCKKIATNVHKANNILITDMGLKSFVRSKFPNLVGTPLCQINCSEIEREVSKSNVVKSCEVFPTPDGTIHIEIYQRRPIMRVFNADGSYYVDADGYEITAHSYMRTHTVIVNGSVNSMLDKSGLIRLCAFIDKNDFWRSMIEQVTVTKDHEFILVPRVGQHIVEFGSADDLERKFANLYALYKSGWAKDEWNVYKRVCLRYHGQIICTKR